MNKLKQGLSGVFLAAALTVGSLMPQAAAAQSFQYGRLGTSNIMIPVQNLNVSNNSVSFVIDKRRVNILAFLAARTGQLYSGALDSSRLCPVFEVASHSFTRQDNGHLRTVTAQVSPSEAAEIRRRGCVTIPDMRNLPR
jgi:hypothetical protein